MAESLVTVVIHLAGAAVERYERDGTAKGIFEQADQVLEDAYKALYKDIDPEDVALIEESLALHPDLQSIDKLKARLRVAKRRHRKHKVDINEAGRLERLWAWSDLTRKVRNELEEVMDLNQDIAATTACPDRSVHNLSEVPKAKRQSRRSKLRASFSRFVSLGKSARDMDPSCAFEKAQGDPAIIGNVEGAEESDLELYEIQETLHQLSELIDAGGDDLEEQVNGVLVQLSPRLPSLALPSDEVLLLKSTSTFASLVLDVPVEVQCADL
ncbi:hypothetical protein PENSPDRAFT_687019 [Peniophora sp. CONT]|nr:hypothetical protein PENSPDRAFT_687019 [Peniophora sp. CONT]